MLEKASTALEPFALTVIVLAGTTLAGYSKFANARIVGIATIFCGVLLIVVHVAKQFKLSKPKSDKKVK